MFLFEWNEALRKRNGAMRCYVDQKVRLKADSKHPIRENRIQPFQQLKRDSVTVSPVLINSLIDRKIGYITVFRTSDTERKTMALLNKWHIKPIHEFELTEREKKR